MERLANLDFGKVGYEQSNVACSSDKNCGKTELTEVQRVGTLISGLLYRH